MLSQQASVLIGVDLLGQVLLGLVGLLVLALFLEELDDLCLVQLNSSTSRPSADRGDGRLDAACQRPS